MLNASVAVEILRSLRPATAVRTPAGDGVVMVWPDNREQAQAHGRVVVLVGGRLVAEFARWEVEPIASVADYTEEDLAWFKRPVTDGELRGLGRTAYRNGKLAHQAVTFAAATVGRELTVIERGLVMRGWAVERAEMAGVQ